jgi:hypothetical protein
MKKLGMLSLIVITVIMVYPRAACAQQEQEIGYLYEHGKLGPAGGFVLAGNPKPVLKEKIEFPKSSQFSGSPLVRLRDGSRFTHMGLIQSREELKEIWADLTNIENAFFGMIPPVPDIDFEKYSVLWFTLQGYGGSGVKVSDILEYENAILMKASVFYSDFGSSDLLLWKIPKTVKPILIQEAHAYERGGP